MGRTEFPDPNGLRREPLVGMAILPLERNGALLGAIAEVCSKVLDTANIVRDAIFQQQSHPREVLSRIRDCTRGYG